MKKFEITLPAWFSRKVFAPIRNKDDSLIVLMQSIKAFISGYDDAEGDAKLTLVVGKMSRLFFFSEDKKFSICFPFRVSETDGDISFSDDEFGTIDNAVTSEVIRIISEGRFRLSSPYELLEEFIGGDRGEHHLWDEGAFWRLFSKLIHSEDGYVRFDHDPERENGTIHPLNWSSSDQI